MNWNERKVLVLGLLVTAGASVVTRDLVDRYGLSYSGSQALLEKYRHQSLLTRRREPGPGPPVYRYFITETGLRKAQWLMLRGLLRSPAQRHLPGLEPELFRPQLAPERFKPKLAPERFKPKLIE